MKYKIIKNAFPPLFIFEAAAFLLFLSGNARLFTDETQYLLLRCVRVSGVFLFIYAILVTLFDTLYEIKYKRSYITTASETPENGESEIPACQKHTSGIFCKAKKLLGRLSMLIFGIIAGLLALVAIIVINIAEGNVN